MGPGRCAHDQPQWLVEQPDVRQLQHRCAPVCGGSLHQPYPGTLRYEERKRWLREYKRDAAWGMVRNEESLLDSTFKLNSVAEYCFKKVTILQFEIQDVDTNINQRHRMS